MKGKAAVHAFTDKADGLLAPLLEEDEVSDSSSDESSAYSDDSSVSTISVDVKQTPMQKLKTVAVYFGLAVGAAASVGAMVLSPAIAVFVMGGLAMVTAPYSAYKENEMTKIPTLRDINNKLRSDALHLEEETDILSEEIDTLQPETERAAEVEEELRIIATEQGRNVDKLVNLVRENEEILTAMKENLRQRIAQDIMKIVITSDRNNDGVFCKVETKMLVLKISLQLQEYGVEFDEAKFYNIMSGNPSVTQTLSIVRRLIPPINELEDDSDDSDDAECGDAYDMFHMASNSSLSSALDQGGPSGGRPSGLSLSLTKKKPAPKRTSGVSLGELPATRRHSIKAARRASASRPESPTPRATASSQSEGEKSQRKRDRLKAALKMEKMSWLAP